MLVGRQFPDYARVLVIEVFVSFCVELAKEDFLSVSFLSSLILIRVVEYRIDRG